VTDVRTVDELLGAARARLERVTPAEAQEAMRAGAVLVDIRSEPQRRRDGTVPGSIFIPRTSWSGAASQAAAGATRASPDPAPG
jgi:hypothetical protein